MPIGFIVLGLMFIYCIFYFKQLKLKILYGVAIGLLLISYFTPTIVVNQSNINVAVLLSCVAVLILSINHLNNLQICYVLGSAIVAGIIYYVLANLNSDFIFTLKPQIVLIIFLIGGLFISFNMQSILMYLSFSVFVLSLLNLIVEVDLGIVNLFSYDMLSTFVIVGAILFAINFVLNKFLIRRKI